jgi:hypothetical protein
LRISELHNRSTALPCLIKRQFSYSNVEDVASLFKGERFVKDKRKAMTAVQWLLENSVSQNTPALQITTFPHQVKGMKLIQCD